MHLKSDAVFPVMLPEIYSYNLSFIQAILANSLYFYMKSLLCHLYSHSFTSDCAEHKMDLYTIYLLLYTLSEVSWKIVESWDRRAHLSQTNFKSVVFFHWVVLSKPQKKIHTQKTENSIYIPCKSIANKTKLFWQSFRQPASS